MILVNFIEIINNIVDMCYNTEVMIICVLVKLRFKLGVMVIRVLFFKTKLVI